jgi:hypothetical protein
MIIKSNVLPDNVCEWKPHSIPFCVVEPGTGLPMNIYHKIKDKLEESQWQLYIFGSIKERYNLSEAKYSNNLQYLQDI